MQGTIGQHRPDEQHLAPHHDGGILASAHDDAAAQHGPAVRVHSETDGPGKPLSTSIDPACPLPGLSFQTNFGNYDRHSHLLRLECITQAETRRILAFLQIAMWATLLTGILLFAFMLSPTSLLNLDHHPTVYIINVTFGGVLLAGSCAQTGTFIVRVIAAERDKSRTWSTRRKKLLFIFLVQAVANLVGSVMFVAANALAVVHKCDWNEDDVVWWIVVMRWTAWNVHFLMTCVSAACIQVKQEANTPMLHHAPDFIMASNEHNQTGKAKSKTTTSNTPRPLSFQPLPITDASTCSHAAAVTGDEGAVGIAPPFTTHHNNKPDVLASSSAQFNSGFGMRACGTPLHRDRSIADVEDGVLHGSVSGRDRNIADVEEGVLHGLVSGRDRNDEGMEEAARDMFSRHQHYQGMEDGEVRHVFSRDRNDEGVEDGTSSGSEGMEDQELRDVHGRDRNNEGVEEGTSSNRQGMEQGMNRDGEGIEMQPCISTPASSVVPSVREQLDIGEVQQAGNSHTGITQHHSSPATTYPKAPISPFQLTSQGSGGMSAEHGLASERSDEPLTCVEINGTCGSLCSNHKVEPTSKNVATHYDRSGEGQIDMMQDNSGSTPCHSHSDRLFDQLQATSQCTDQRIVPLLSSEASTSNSVVTAHGCTNGCDTRTVCSPHAAKQIVPADATELNTALKRQEGVNRDALQYDGQLPLEKDNHQYDVQLLLEKDNQQYKVQPPFEQGNQQYNVQLPFEQGNQQYTTRRATEQSARPLAAAQAPEVVLNIASGSPDTMRCKDPMVLDDAWHVHAWLLIPWLAFEAVAILNTVWFGDVKGPELALCLEGLRMPVRATVVQAVLIALMAVWFLLFLLEMRKAKRFLRRRPYTEFRLANTMYQLQMRLGTYMFIVLLVGLGLVWLGRLDADRNYRIIVFGFLPVEILWCATAGGACFFFVPQHPSSLQPLLTQQLQEFAWTEASLNQQIQERDASTAGMTAGEPMFCLQTAANMFYWTCLAYDFSENNPSLATPYKDLDLDELAKGLKLYNLRCYKLLTVEEQGLKALCVWSEDIILITFRGSAHVSNYLADLMVWRKVHPSLHGRNQAAQACIHSGFLKCWVDNGLQKKVMDLAETLITSSLKEVKIYLTGHSLGGALATLAAYDLVKTFNLKPTQVSCYTFGTPRAGNRAFAREYHRCVPDTWHVINDQDLVPRGGKFISMYKRNGHRVIITRAGDLVVRPTPLEVSLLQMPFGSSFNHHLLSSYQESLAAAILSQLDHQKAVRGGLEGSLQLLSSCPIMAEAVRRHLVLRIFRAGKTAAAKMSRLCTHMCGNRYIQYSSDSLVSAEAQLAGINPELLARSLRADPGRRKVPRWSGALTAPHELSLEQLGLTPQAADRAARQIMGADGEEQVESESVRTAAAARVQSVGNGQSVRKMMDSISDGDARTGAASDVHRVSSYSARETQDGTSGNDTRSAVQVGTSSPGWQFANVAGRATNSAGAAALSGVSNMRQEGGAGKEIAHAGPQVGSRGQRLDPALHHSGQDGSLSNGQSVSNPCWHTCIKEECELDVDDTDNAEMTNTARVPAAVTKSSSVNDVNCPSLSGCFQAADAVCHSTLAHSWAVLTGRGAGTASDVLLGRSAGAASDADSANGTHVPQISVTQAADSAGSPVLHATSATGDCLGGNAHQSTELAQDDVHDTVCLRPIPAAAKDGTVRHTQHAFAAPSDGRGRATAASSWRDAQNASSGPVDAVTSSKDAGAESVSARTSLPRKYEVQNRNTGLGGVGGRKVYRRGHGSIDVGDLLRKHSTNLVPELPVSGALIRDTAGLLRDV